MVGGFGSWEDGKTSILRMMEGAPGADALVSSTRAQADGVVSGSFGLSCLLLDRKGLR